MTDIVERLRTWSDIHRHGAINGGDLMAEAADEIERLRGLLEAKTTPGYELLAGTIEEKDAEIERLRHENMRLQTANDYAFGPKGELANKDREIKRLRDVRET